MTDVPGESFTDGPPALYINEAIWDNNKEVTRGFLMSRFIAELMSGTQLNSAFVRQPLEDEKPGPGKSGTPSAKTAEAASEEITRLSRAIEMSETILKQRRDTAIGVTQSLKL